MTVSNTTEDYLHPLPWLGRSLGCRYRGLQQLRWARYRGSAASGVPGDVLECPNDVSGLSFVSYTSLTEL